MKKTAGGGFKMVGSVCYSQVMNTQNMDLISSFDKIPK